MVQLTAQASPAALQETIAHLVQHQRQFFNTGKTKEIEFRLAQLQALRQMVISHQDAILAALKADLNKPELEAYTADLGVLQEINYAIKHLRRWAKPRSVPVTLVQLPGRAKIYPEPLGVVLVISPWNYPFQLTISPLLAAIAAGNCVLVKPSELAPRTSHVIAELISQTFDPGFVSVVEGDAAVSQALLEERFDHIFFTGGSAVGRMVMTAAAKHLTPVTLELGGKSPCIVDRDIQVEYTARRIVWGKFLNAGQTCIAPDYLLVDRQIKPALLAAMQKTLQEFYGDDPIASPDYARIINDRHYARLEALLQSGEQVAGGKTDAEQRYIAPTILDQVSWDDPVMQDEIFGPILPVLTYEDVNEAIDQINQRPKPLALYLFSRNQKLQQQVLHSTSSGGVCLNDTVMQVGVPALPFGGVGESGMGSYHGKAGFDTFSHFKSVLQKPFWPDLPLRYPPYTGKLDLVKRLIK